MLLKEESLVMVTTDGHRLAYIEHSNHFDGISGQVKGLIPKKAMTELLKLVGEAGGSAEVEFATDENHLFFHCGARLLITRKLTGQFPDYQRVLPAERGTPVALNRDEATAAIRRVAQFADDRSHAIRLELNPGELRLVSSGSDVGESEESIPVEYTGEKRKVGFNSQYLLDFLSAAGTETVELDFHNEESAGQLQLAGVEGYEYRYVVMPMRI
jgi:DNA polymerase-3 subunit beta